MNPDARSYTPTFYVQPTIAACKREEQGQASKSCHDIHRRKGVVYTREELVRLRLSTPHLALHDSLSRLPFILDTCSDVHSLLQLSYMKELLSPDIYNAPKENNYDDDVQGQPSLHTSNELSPNSCPSKEAVSARTLIQHMEHDLTACSYNCKSCATVEMAPCEEMQRLLTSIRRAILATTTGACLLQGGTVVWSLTQLALVFETKQSSIRMRRLADKCPKAVRLMTEYLCGEGYHMPLPGVSEHEKWAHICTLLKFDAIRDNQTRIKTDLSKHWRRRTTPFEQFVYFFAFRDDRPRVAVRNVITRSVKPGMVAMLTGDIVAMLLLHSLGFFLPPDYYWNVYPFLNEALGRHSVKYDTVRHLAVTLSTRQDANLYNPVPPPKLRTEDGASYTATSKTGKALNL